MLAGTLPSCRTLSRWAYPLFLVVLLLLAAVYWFPAVNGAKRWIRLGPVGFQPSELAKVVFVLALARYLADGENSRRPLRLLLPLGLTLLPVVLILREPDLGTATLLVPVLFWMLYVAGTRRGNLLRLALIGLLAMPVLWAQMSREQRSRVTALFEQVGPGESTASETYQLYQAKQTMALGSVWGSVWTGQAAEDLAVYHLPEAHSDFVFCVLVERLGLPGAVLILALYALLVWRGLAVAAATQDPFGRLVAAGLTGMLAVQVLVNLGMAVGLLPVVGLSLPLVSYGGSGLVAQGILLGLILNVGLRPGYDVAGEPFRYEASGGPARSGTVRDGFLALLGKEA